MVNSHLQSPFQKIQIIGVRNKAWDAGMQDNYQASVRNAQQMYGSRLVFFHFMPCFCTFFRSTLLEIKFCRNLFHSISFCFFLGGFWNQLQNIYNMNVFIILKTNTFGDEDKRVLCWRRIFHKVIVIFSSSMKWPTTANIGTWIKSLEQRKNVCMMENLVSTLWTKSLERRQNVCMVENSVSTLNLVYICNCRESAPNTQKTQLLSAWMQCHMTKAGVHYH